MEVDDPTRLGVGRGEVGVGDADGEVAAGVGRDEGGNEGAADER